MKRLVMALVVTAALVVGATSSGAAPITKQNGKTPAFNEFTSICAVAGYANYGECGGDVTKFTDVEGKINVVQAKADRYNLGFEFSGLEPYEPYTLHGNNGGTWLLGLASGVADADGKLKLSWQANGATLSGIGFDLNHNYGTTIVTSYWTGQVMHVTNGMLDVVQYPLRDSSEMTAGETSRFYLAAETIGAESFVAFDLYTPAVTVVANGLVAGSVLYVGWIETTTDAWVNLGAVTVDANGYAKATFLLTAATTYAGYFAINSASGTQFIAGPFAVTTH